MDTGRVVNLMEERGLDAIVVSSPENVRYLSGSFIITQRLIRERLALVVIPRSDSPVLLVCGIEESLVRSESWIRDIRIYVELAESPIHKLADLLQEKRLARKRVGIEEKYFTVEQYCHLQALLPSASFFGCDGLLTELRRIKAPEEIQLLKFAALATRKAVETAFSLAKPGDTEREIARSMADLLLQNGADSVDFLVLGAGQRGALVHPVPSDKRIEGGEVVRVDVGGLFSGYYSDLARTAVVGEPNSRQADIYAKMIEIQKAMIAQMRAGTRISSLYNLQKSLFEQSDLVFNTPHIGHGIGLNLHEDPMIAPSSHDLLEENMVINVEPFSLDGTQAGYHIEDLVLVTEAGPRVLTETDFNPLLPTIA